MSSNDPRRPPAAPSHRWQDWVNLILAVWLFVSPWALRFGVTAAPDAAVAGSSDAANQIVAGAAAGAAANAWALSGVIALLSAVAIGRRQAWPVWLTALCGAWLAVAPSALDFRGLPGATWDHWAVGALVFLVAVSRLLTFRPATAPRRTEARYAGSKPGSRR